MPAEASVATHHREENSAGQSKSRILQRQPVQDAASSRAYACAAAPAAAALRARNGPRFKNVRGDQKMTTSIARKALLGAAIAASMGIGYAIGAQPHMTASLGMLQSARAELAAATPNKGGHREKAMGLIDQAIGEIRAGIAFAGG
jgi:hypothetical protein